MCYHISLLLILLSVIQAGIRPLLRIIFCHMAHGFLQSAVSLVTLSMEGLISVTKRELRFVIEPSIKLCLERFPPDLNLFVCRGIP